MCQPFNACERGIFRPSVAGQSRFNGCERGIFRLSVADQSSSPQYEFYFYVVHENVPSSHVERVLKSYVGFSTSFGSQAGRHARIKLSEVVPIRSNDASWLVAKHSPTFVFVHVTSSAFFLFFVHKDSQISSGLNVCEQKRSIVLTNHSYHEDRLPVAAGRKLLLTRQWLHRVNQVHISQARKSRRSEAQNRERRTERKSGKKTAHRAVACRVENELHESLQTIIFALLLLNT